MTATVRLFAHSGISMAHVANYSEQRADQSIALLRQPYLGRATMTVDTGAPQSSPAGLSPQHSRILLIQVDPGKRCHYEISPPGRSGGPVAADTSSPVVEGDEQLEWGPDWSISLIEAS
jgi:hypothetical protein